MSVKVRDMEAVFRKLDVEPIPCRHHIRGYVKFKGRILFPLYYSFGRGDIPGFVVEKIAKTMHLSREDLIAMMGCSITKKQYFKKLIDGGLI
jgi:hypothetical protein